MYFHVEFNLINKAEHYFHLVLQQTVSAEGSRMTWGYPESSSQA